MAFFIPVDLFGSYTDGYEIGRKSVWDDRNQAEKVTEARIKNIHDADTLEGRIADTNNKYFDNYLGYQVNEHRQPGNLAQADIYNVSSLDARDVAYEPDQRTLNKNTLRTGNQLAYEANRANLRQARGTYVGGGVGGGAYSQPSGATRQATYDYPSANGGQGQATYDYPSANGGQGQGALFSWGAAGAATTSNAQPQTQPSSGADIASSYVNVKTDNNRRDGRPILSQEEAQAQWEASDLYRQSQEVVTPENVEERTPPLVYPPGRKPSPYPVWDDRPSAISGVLPGRAEASRSSLAEWNERRNAQMAPPRPKKEVAPIQPEQPRRSNSQMFMDSIRGGRNAPQQPNGNLSGPVKIDVVGEAPATQAEYDARAIEVQNNINNQQVAYEQSLFDSIEDEDLLLFAEQGQLPAGVYQFSYPNELGYSGIFVDENKNVQYV